MFSHMQEKNMKTIITNNMLHLWYIYLDLPWKWWISHCHASLPQGNSLSPQFCSQRMCWSPKHHIFHVRPAKVMVCPISYHWHVQIWAPKPVIKWSEPGAPISIYKLGFDPRQTRFEGHLRAITPTYNLKTGRGLPWSIDPNKNIFPSNSTTSDTSPAVARRVDGRQIHCSRRVHSKGLQIETTHQSIVRRHLKQLFLGFGPTTLEIPAKSLASLGKSAYPDKSAGDLSGMVFHDPFKG